jgi:hypothetical protein
MARECLDAQQHRETSADEKGLKGEEARDGPRRVTERDEREIST